MKLLNICTRKTYQKDGQEFSSWYKVGILKIAESGKQYIKLFQQPDTEFFVFENESEIHAHKA